jgi:pimeloyl-ACP methyl ester carboxylesterase
VAPTLLIVTFLLPAGLPVASRFEQVLPVPPPGKWLVRSPGQGRAVVLLHGLHAHPVDESKAGRPLLRDWQRPGSRLARALAEHADVFAFAYAQDVPVEVVAPRSTLRADVRALRALGYREVVLVGHSAGGLVARQLVEDFPDVGVTKVIQVCCPNGGSSWGRWRVAVRETQEVFLVSLTKEAREEALRQRRDTRIPAGVQFVCVVGTGSGVGDGVVLRSRQWTEDLQEQGVPAVPLKVVHPTAMRSAKSASVLADLVRRPVPRWDRDRVAAERKKVLGD